MRQVSVLPCGASLPLGSRICHCEACCAVFTGVTSFDAHRRGRHGIDRFCASAVQMVNLGLRLDQNGRWGFPAGARRTQASREVAVSHFSTGLGDSTSAGGSALLAAAAPRLLLSVEEAALALGIGRTVMYSLLAADEIRRVRIGRRTLVPLSALQAYVDKHTTAAV